MNKIKIICCCLSCLFLTGCWDKIEIDRNLFVSTIGIDVGKDIKNDKDIKKIEPNEPFGERQMERLNIVYAFPDINEYTAQKGALPEDKFIKTEAYSMEDAESNATAKSSRNINVGHSKLLVLSNDIFKYPDVFKEIVDYLTRQPKINRMMYVVVVDGRVEDFMKTKVTTEKNIEAYLTGLMMSSKRNSSILPVTLNEFLILLSQNGNALLPNAKLDKSKNEISITGVSIIKNYSIKGSLTPQETASLEMIRGRLQGGKKVIYKDGHPIDMEIDEVKRKIKSNYNEGKLSFDIDIELEGKIKGYYLEKNILNKNELDSIESNFNEALSEECEKIIKVTQNQFSVDPVGLREHIEKFHPFQWDKINKDWENVYKDAVVNVNVDTNIRRIGPKE